MSAGFFFVVKCLPVCFILSFQNICKKNKIKKKRVDNLDLLCKCVSVYPSPCLYQEVSEVLEKQKHLMKCVLDDTCLNRLRLEGGTVLARIRKEEACDNENYR